MDQKKFIDELSARIAQRECAIFAGAGFTCDGGGLTWEGLVEFLIEKFDYKSPLRDNFKKMKDLCDRHTRQTVYTLIQDKLKDVRVPDYLVNWTTFPWFTVFTTNYDTALEKALESNQKCDIRTIVTGQEFVLTGIQSEMLCVKLMGSLDISHDNPGSMIIDSGDLVIAREERSRIFDTLANHAANISFLFVGYSFNDQIFLDTLDKLHKAIGKPSVPYFAIFRDTPDEEHEYLFKQYGIEFIVGELKEIAPVLTEQVNAKNPTDFTRKSIVVGKDIISINTQRVGSFLSRFNLILSENIKAEVTPLHFFRGFTESFNPFRLEWHFKRGQTTAIVKIARSKKLKELSAISVEGAPGTGKTFTIMAAITDLIFKHRFLAIKVTNDYNQVPVAEELESFMEEIGTAAQSSGVDCPRSIVFWLESVPDNRLFVQFARLMRDSKYQVVFIFEGKQEKSLEKLRINSINVADSIDEKEKSGLADYIKRTIKTHKLSSITTEDANAIIVEEKLFISIMYRSIDPARRSINRIIFEEFEKLTDKLTIKCVLLCALATMMGVKVPLSILRKILTRLGGKELSYADTCNIAMARTGAFVEDCYDNHNNCFFSVFHAILANQIIKKIGINAVNDILVDIVNSASLKSRAEANFIGSIFITNGVGRVLRNRYVPFSVNGLIHALEQLKKFQPARPILHHLARLYQKNNINDGRIFLLLDEALAEPKEHYALAEDKGYVLNTLASFKWEKNESELLDSTLKDPKIKEIFDILERAKAEDLENLYPYDVQARIIKKMTWHAKDEQKKLQLVNEGIKIVTNGIDLNIDDWESEERLNKLLIEFMAEINPENAERHAESLLKNSKDGSGFYTLARYINSQGGASDKDILNLINRAMKGDIYPVETIAFKMEILLKDNTPNYAELVRLADDISSKDDFRCTWRSSLQKGIIYAIDGRYKSAIEHFAIAYKRAPRLLQRRVEYFWMEDGRRKMFNGKIGVGSTFREGRLYAHNVPGWQESIFFDPRHQKKSMYSLNSGLSVNFEIGFSPKGLIAFDVRPARKGGSK